MIELTIEQIQYLKAVIDFGSFEKAANETTKTKTAIIYSIKKLEENLGFDLLDRSGYRVVPTIKGIEFLNHSKSLLKEYEKLLSVAKLLEENVEQKISLSISSIMNMLPLYPIIQNTMNTWPETEVLLEREVLSGEKLLAKDEVNLAIMEHIENQIDYEYKQIAKVKMMLVIGKNHPITRLSKKNQTFKELYNSPQIVMRSTIQEGSRDIGIHEQATKWRVNDIFSKKEMILNHIGWGALPHHLIEKELKNKSIKSLRHLQPDVEIPIYLARRRNSMHGKVAEYFWNQF